MKIRYWEILKALGPPLWWTAEGYPRYISFAPQECSRYAKEAALIEVACQACKRIFVVGMSRTNYDPPWEYEPEFGDPPNVECCAAGPTMTTEYVKSIEHWVQTGPNRTWVAAPLWPPEEDE